MGYGRAVHCCIADSLDVPVFFFFSCDWFSYLFSLFFFPNIVWINRWSFVYMISGETAKWEKITYLGIATCTVLAVYNLSQGHPHHEEPPVSFIFLSFLFTLFMVVSYLICIGLGFECLRFQISSLRFFHLECHLTFFFFFTSFLCSNTHICTFATRSFHGVCIPFHSSDLIIHSKKRMIIIACFYFLMPLPATSFRDG